MTLKSLIQEINAYLAEHEVSDYQTLKSLFHELQPLLNPYPKKGTRLLRHPLIDLNVTRRRVRRNTSFPSNLTHLVYDKILVMNIQFHALLNISLKELAERLSLNDGLSVAETVEEIQHLRGIKSLEDKIPEGWDKQTLLRIMEDFNDLRKSAKELFIENLRNK